MICPSVTAIYTALSVKTLFTNGAGLAPGVYLCNYSGYGVPIHIVITLYKGMSATNVSQLMKANPSTTYTSVIGVGDQAETFSVSGQEGIIAAKGTTVVQVVIYGTVPGFPSSVETLANRLF